MSYEWPRLRNPKKRLRNPKNREKSRKKRKKGKKKGKKRGKKEKKGKKGKKEENFPPRRPRPEPPMGKKSLSQNNPMCERSEDWGVWRLKRFFSMMGALDLFFDCDSDARVRSALAALKLELSLFFDFFSRFLTNFHDFSWKTTPTHRLRTAYAPPTQRPRTAHALLYPYMGVGIGLGVKVCQNFSISP